MRNDRYAAFGLTEVDEPFRRAVRDGFKGAGLGHAQLMQALEWYRDHVRPGMSATALAASFSEFATAKGWSIEQQFAASSVHDAIRDHGVAAVAAPAPSPEEDAATIAKANELLAKDAAAYFADTELQEQMFEALERQAAPEGSPPAPAPAPSDVEIEQRIGRADMAKIEAVMRTDPQRYFSSPQLQQAYRDAIERANAELAPAEAPAAAPAAVTTPVAPAGAPAATPEPKPEAA
jgi:hypothetical protein